LLINEKSAEELQHSQRFG